MTVLAVAIITLLFLEALKKSTMKMEAVYSSEM
jgi:hypothetical protein